MLIVILHEMLEIFEKLNSLFRRKSKEAKILFEKKPKTPQLSRQAHSMWQPQTQKWICNVTFLLHSTHFIHFAVRCFFFVERSVAGVYATKAKNTRILENLCVRVTAAAGGLWMQQSILNSFCVLLVARPQLVSNALNCATRRLRLARILQMHTKGGLAALRMCHIRVE